MRKLIRDLRRLFKTFNGQPFQELTREEREQLRVYLETGFSNLRVRA